MMATPDKSCPKCGAPIRVDQSCCGACLLESALDGFNPESLEGAASSVGGFELLAEIGRGGQGIVYRARQKGLNRTVALKVISRGHWGGDAQLKRFRLEAEAAGSLDHPGIVPIYEIGEMDGWCYFTMRLIEGRPLDAAIRGNPWPSRKAAGLLAKVAAAVHYAHQRGVLHRDVKPSNILLDAQDDPHLTDFGLAKLVSKDNELTRSNVLLGTPAYMAPEQASGQAGQVTTGADVYSLGAVLYEMLTGRPPFNGSTLYEIARQVVETPPQRPSELQPPLERDLETICLKCLEKEPERRYLSAQLLADDLERFLKGEPIHARQAPPAERLWRWCLRNPILAFSIGISLASLIAVAVGSTIAALRIQHESRQRAQAEIDAKERLWSSYIAQARATRLSGVAGRRFKALTAVASAAAMKTSIELRNEAIAALALTDIDDAVLHHERDPQTTFNGVAPFPDFRRYVVFHEHGEGAIHELPTRRVLQRFDAPPHRGTALRFSRTGRFMAGQFQCQVSVWDTTDVTQARTNFPVVPEGGQPVAFTADERTMAVPSSSGLVHLYDLASGKESSRMNPGAPASRLEFDPTGRFLALNPGGSVQVWDTGTGQRVAAAPANASSWNLAWHPSGRHLAIGLESGELLLWEPANNSVRTLAAHNLNVSNVSFDPQGDLLLSQSWDGTTRFWDGWNGAALFAGSKTVAWNFSLDGGKLWYELDVGTLGTWNVTRSRICKALHGVGQRGHNLRGVSFSPNSRWLAVGEPAGFAIFSTATGQQAAFIQARTLPLPIFHPTGDAIVSIGIDSIQRWPFQVNDSGIPVVGNPETIFSSPGVEFQHGELSPDGAVLAVAGHHRSVVIDLNSPQKPVRVARGFRQSYASVSPDARWISVASYYGIGVTVWDAKTGERLRHLVTNDNARVQFSADGGTLVTGGARELVAWDTKTWERRYARRLDMPGHVGVTVAANPSASMMAAAPARREILLFDPLTGKDLCTLISPQAENIDMIQFSPDGRYLASTSVNQVVHLWDLQTLRRELAAMNLDW